MGFPTVMIGFMPAARVGDMAVCVGPPDTIAKGSMTVFIGNMQAARMGDPTAHGGVIVMGCPTVIIGDVGMGAAIAADQHAPLSMTFQDALTDQESVVRKAAEQACVITKKAIARLEAAKTTPDSLVGTYFGINSVSDNDKAKIDSLIAKYSKVQSKLEKGVSYEIENETIKPGEPYTVAYVYKFPIIGGIGDVHICFPAFDTLSSQEQSATIVHELSHYSAGTDNHAYSWETSKWNKMSQDQQMDNADSLSGFASNT